MSPGHSMSNRDTILSRGVRVTDAKGERYHTHLLWNAYVCPTCDKCAVMLMWWWDPLFSASTSGSHDSWGTEPIIAPEGNSCSFPSVGVIPCGSINRGHRITTVDCTSTQDYAKKTVYINDCTPIDNPNATIICSKYAYSMDGQAKHPFSVLDSLATMCSNCTGNRYCGCDLGGGLSD